MLSIMTSLYLLLLLFGEMITITNVNNEYRISIKNNNINTTTTIFTDETTNNKNNIINVNNKVA